MICLYRSYENGETLVTIRRKKGGKYKLSLERRSNYGISFTIKEKEHPNLESADKEFRAEYKKVKKKEYEETQW